MSLTCERLDVNCAKDIIIIRAYVELGSVILNYSKKNKSTKFRLNNLHANNRKQKTKQNKTKQ